MLILWDYEISDRADVIRQLDRGRMFDLATSVVEGTIELFDPPFNEYFPLPIAELLGSAIRTCRESAPEWLVDKAWAEDFFDTLDLLPKVAVRPGVGPFSMAIENLVEALSEGRESDAALNVLSSCYEAILTSQLTGRVTLGMERENEKCRRAIELQQSLISGFAL
ncbi:hypothetical protein [Streptomyces sp. NPDC059564]|uniref:hypothetical protein n=1 Tax=Streptomyces sp. NPDC059564 TaxID=3346865 RepID=UPI0036B2543A